MGRVGRTGRLRLLGVSLGVALAFLSFHPVHESDPFWQMTLGRAVLAHGARIVPEPTAFRSWTAPAVVPEWLWAVATYELHQVGGWPALAGVVAVLALAAGLATTRLAVRRQPAAPEAAPALVAVLAAVLLASRLRLRPQAAFLVILPAFLLGVQAYLRAEHHRLRLAWGGALAATEILWAQVHGSFVLGPAIFALGAAPVAWHARTRREVWPDLALLVLLAGACATSAYGLHVIGYIAVHSSGDAARHMADMHAPGWATFNPTATPYGAAYLGLWALAAAGALAARRLDLAAFGWALLGLALAVDATRFFAAAGVLLVPLAADGAAHLTRVFRAARWWQPAAALAGAGLFVWAGFSIQSSFGPLGRIGLAPGVHPQAAAAFLARAPAGSRVLSSMDASAPLGFWLAGRVRTYVDSRTPLYFDNTDFGVARDIWSWPDALADGLARYRPWAVVVRRDVPACRYLASGEVRGWVATVVEPRFTTFVPRGRAPALRALAPCGEHYLTEDACAAGGARLDADIARLAALRNSPFVGYLRAERSLRCADDAAAAARELPAKGDAWPYRAARARLLGRILVARGRIRAARDVLAPLARSGNLDALNILGPALIGTPYERSLRGILQDAVTRWDDRAPPDLRADLAILCMHERDSACVRFEGLRAAARGNARAAPALRWLAAHPPSAEAGRDAQAWLAVLESRTASHRSAGDQDARKRP